MGVSPFEGGPPLLNLALLGRIMPSAKSGSREKGVPPPPMDGAANTSVSQ